MTMRAIIVDDSDLDRFNLRVLLKRCPGITCIADCGSLQDAVATINREKPDLVFLDIQMPGGSGFDVLAALENAPHIIFVTAFDHYAVKAFEINAVDYLLKPILLERLQAALARLPANGKDAAMSPATRALTTGEQVFLKSRNRQLFAEVSEIAAIGAAGDYSAVYLIDRPPLEVRRRMAEWLEILPVELFFQVDRSLVVNRNRIRGIERLSRTNAKLTIAGVEKPFQIGRAGLERLQEPFP